MRKLTGLFLSLLVVIMAGCGGGGGGGGTAATPGGGTLPSNTNNVSGIASKGPLSGASVAAYRIISSASLNPRIDKSKAIATDTTGATGSYNLAMPKGTGAVVVEITHGSYKDESTGAARNLDDQYPSGMHAIFGNISGVTKRGESISVTPYTDMAYKEAAQNPSEDNIKSSNDKVAAAFNLPDIVRTKPADPNSAFTSTTSDDAKKYALALATISQYQKDFGGGKSLDDIASSLVTQLASGSLSAQTAASLGASTNNYANGSQNVNTELKDPSKNSSAPSAIHATPALPTSAAINTAVTVTAHVVESDGTSVVPDGTLVNFSSAFGTLSASSAATVGGFASVTITSASVGTASVVMSAGTASVTAAAISFVDPAAPTSVTLTAGASSGITSGAPVTLSASVVKAAGGAVANGTVVTFVIVSGTGTLSSATATTTSGVASVNLSSSIGGASVGVRASAGGISSNTLSVPFTAQPTKAIVKVSTSGTLGSGILIGAIDTTVSYSTGSGLSITAANVAASGVSNIGPTTNANTAGQVRFALTTTSGLGLGEFVTLTFDIAAGKFPTTQDFSIAALPATKILDTNVNNLPGVSVIISSVTIQ
jgi:hypothetical protein